MPTLPAQAKGRNGYFKVGEILLWRDAYDGGFHIEVLSTRPGKAAPCRIELAAEDALQFGRLIQDTCCDPSSEDDEEARDV